MIVTLVVAAAENGVIGKDNALLWRLPDDLKFFKSVTLGKPIIMGRKTFAAIGRPLPGRRNIVISRQTLQIPGCDTVTSLDAALALVAEAPEVAVIGGAQIYRLALPLAHVIHLTRVHATLDGDVYFDFPAEQWREVQRDRHEADERHAYAFTFIKLERLVAT